MVWGGIGALGNFFARSDALCGAGGPAGDEKCRPRVDGGAACINTGPPAPNYPVAPPTAPSDALLPGHPIAHRQSKWAKKLHRNKLKQDRRNGVYIDPGTGQWDLLGARAVKKQAIDMVDVHAVYGAGVDSANYGALDDVSAAPAVAAPAPVKYDATDYKALNCILEYRGKGLYVAPVTQRNIAKRMDALSPGQKEKFDRARAYRAAAKKETRRRTFVSMAFEKSGHVWMDVPGIDRMYGNASGSSSSGSSTGSLDAESQQGAACECGNFVESVCVKCAPMTLAEAASNGAESDDGTCDETFDFVEDGRSVVPFAMDDDDDDNVISVDDMKKNSGGIGGFIASYYEGVTEYFTNKHAKTGGRNQSPVTGMPRPAFEKEDRDEILDRLDGVRHLARSPTGTSAAVENITKALNTMSYADVIKNAMRENSDSSGNDEAMEDIKTESISFMGSSAPTGSMRTAAYITNRVNGPVARGHRIPGSSIPLEARYSRRVLRAGLREMRERNAAEGLRD
jgi:hypothetical protein